MGEVGQVDKGVQSFPEVFLSPDVNTSVISDALDEAGELGVLTGISNQTPVAGMVVGRALPVRFEPKSGDTRAYRFGGGVGRPLEQVLGRIEAGQIPIFDLGGTHEASPWGGLASRLAQARGVRGTIVWGCCRDVEEAEALGYPIWAVGKTPRRSRNEFTFGSVGQAIKISGVTIATGDLVAADRTGVVVIPASRVNEVAVIITQIVKQERALLCQIREGGEIDWNSV